MNVLFLSLLDFDTFDERNIYSDLLREFIKNGHKVLLYFACREAERTRHQYVTLWRELHFKIKNRKIRKR